MTQVTTIIKYSMVDTAGVVGQQPFKKKARFDTLFDWQLIDKLNEIKEFNYTVPNDEFHRANALIERKIFVPFIKPFRGLLIGESKDESRIILRAKEFATHLERRVFIHDGEKRITFTTEDWYKGPWKYRVKLAVNKKQVADEVKEFPILVNIPTSTSFKNQAQSTGNDFVFTSKDGITKIPHEIEKYDLATGELIAWVKIPKISDTSDAIFYVYYGNPDVVNQEDIVNVWKDTNVLDAGTKHAFEGVWHLKENPIDTPPEYKDSTENNNDGTETAVTRATAQIGDGVQFDAINSKIDMASDITIDDVFDSNGWYTTWINPNSDGEGNLGVIADKVNWILRTRDEAGGFLRLELVIDFDTTDGIWQTAVDIPINVNTRIDVIYDNSLVGNDPTIYINGVAKTVGDGLTRTSTPVGTRVSDAGANLIIGNNTGQTATFDGEIDEVRADKTVPPNISNLIKTEYNNQNVPTIFITEFPAEQYQRPAKTIAQQIVDSANNDQPSGVTWTLGEDFPGDRPTGEIAFLGFDDSLLDETNANDGTITGLEAYIAGKIGTGKAISLNGNSFVTLANEANFDRENNQLLSVSGWIKTALDGVIVAKRDSVAGEGWFISMTAGGAIRFLMEGVGGAGDRIDVETTATTFKDNVSHHFLITKSKLTVASSVKIYVDGVLQTLTTTTDNLTGSILNNIAVTIGAQGDGISKITGEIDDVYIYHKELTADDAKNLFDLAVETITLGLNFKTHFESLQEVALILGKDVFFDNDLHKVFIDTKGKTLDQILDIVITSKPEKTTEAFANEINMLGKTTEVGKQLEKVISTTTVLRFNYEKTVADNQLNTPEQLEKVGDNLLKEFQKLTPQIKGEIPFNQFNRLNLESGDIVKISQPDKQLNGSFRIMDIIVNIKKARLSLESTETGVIRLRSLSFTDIISGILKRIENQSIES